jgi:hypothetical protein
VAKKSKAQSNEAEATPEPVHIAAETLPEPKDEAKEDSKVNKSEEIRAEADRLKANGEELRPETIVENLAEQGITVSPPLVSPGIEGAWGPSATP